MGPKLRTVERRLARIAGASHGVVTRAQALRAGITDKELKHRIRIGALTPVHRGVYRVGHRAPSVEAGYLAAVLACGDGALLSGLAAAYVHGLVRGPAPKPEVTARTDRRVKGVSTRKRARIETSRSRGIPVTTVERTLVDIAASLSRDELARAFHEANIRYGTTPQRVESALGRRANARGAKRLRAVLHGDTPVALSTLERDFRNLLRGDNLELPETNCQVGSYRVDCRWPRHRLTVELDGYRYHRTRYAWDRDRRREREARARGDDFRRYTWSDVYEYPDELLADLRPLLSGSKADFGPQ